MHTFLRLYVGQWMSHLGSHLAGFALGIWMLQRTGSMSVYALTLLAANLPPVLIGPVAGVLADRYDRRAIMLFGLLGACACSMAIVAMDLTGVLAPWHAVTLIALTATCKALQTPAFEALVATLVPPAQLNRANGIVQLGYGLAHLAAPLAAGLLLPRIGLRGIYLIDVTTFVAALALLATVRLAPGVARAPRSAGSARASVWADAREGWGYLAQRPALVAWLVLGGLTNLTFGMVETLFTPLVLSFSGTEVLGLVHSIGGLGFVAGGIITTVWTGAARLPDIVLAFMLLQGSVLMIAVLKPSAVLAGVGTFGFLFALAFIVTYSQTIWQRAVPAALQGRVFALRMMCNRLAFAVAAPVAGLLGDHVLEPLMTSDTRLAAVIGVVVGTGEGRGAALAIALLGAGTVLAAIAGFAYRPARGVLPPEARPPEPGDPPRAAPPAAA